MQRPSSSSRISSSNGGGNFTVDIIQNPPPPLHQQLARKSPRRRLEGGTATDLSVHCSGSRCSCNRCSCNSISISIGNSSSGSSSVSNSFSNKRRTLLRSRFSEKWIHLIPVVVILCFVILWWFSYPVRPDIKEGRIIAIHPFDPSHLVNQSHEATLTGMDYATLPADNETVMHTVSLSLTSNNDTAMEMVGDESNLY